MRRIFLDLLALCYPREFRSRYGKDLRSTAQQILTEGQQRSPLFRVWVRVRLSADALSQGLAERFRSLTWGSPKAPALFSDLRQAVRSLFRRPGFTALSALTLSLGIAAVTVVFGLFNAVLLQPLPFHEPDRLVGLWHAAPGLRPDDINQSPASYFLYRDHTESFSNLGLWDNSQATVTGLSEPTRVGRMIVTEGFLPTLGFPLAVGRGFTRDDDRPGAPGTTILTNGFWKTEFGGDPNVVGRTISLDGEPHQVIGVLEDGFVFPRPALLTPARFDRGSVMNGDFSYQIIARLSDGVTLDQAQADLERALPRLATDFAGSLTPATLRDGRFRPVVRSLRDDFVGDAAAPLWVLLGVVGVVLLIACANVGNLYLVRAEGRHQEIALRTAMGASRTNILRTYLLESTALAILGGVLGVCFAALGIKVLVAQGPNLLTQIPNLGVSLPVLGFAFAVSVFSGILFGLLPFVRSGGTDLVSALKEGSKGAGFGRSGRRLRNGLVVAQVAMALVLLVGSGLMVRSFAAMTEVHPGFEDPDQLMTVTLGLAEGSHPDQNQTILAHQAISQALAALPGVTGTGASTSVSLDGRDSHNSLHFEAFPLAPGDLPAVHRVKYVAGDYATTMGIPLVAGRNLSWDDIHERRRAVVVSEDLALRYWSNPTLALGQRLGFDSGDWWEIVGVTGAIHDDGLHLPTVPIVYFPMAGRRADGSDYVIRTMTHVVRTPQGPRLLPEIRSAIWSVDSDLPLDNLGSHGEVVSASLAQTAFSMALLLASGAIALLLGTVGIYSVVSYLVSQRTRELGVRMALGASRNAVGRLVVRSGMGLVAIGIGLGLIGAVGLGSLMEAALFGVTPTDPVTYVSVAFGLSAVALIATWLPARRAARVDPVVALRWE